MDSLCRVRNIIMNVLAWRTVSVLTRVLFWYLFTSLLRNSGNKHQNNPLVSTETVCHWSTYISLYLFDSMALSKQQAIIWTNVDTVYWPIYAGLHEFIIPPASTKLKGGYTGFTLSVCGQNGVRSVSSTILIRSFLYLHILSSNFRRCVACNVCFKIKHLKFWRIL